jgi:uncharacterized protein (TIGR03435 family)
MRLPLRDNGNCRSGYAALAAASLHALLILLAPGGASAQAPGDPTFEVASIKPNTSGTNQRQVGLGPNGRFTAINVPLHDLVRLAFAETGPDGVFAPLPPNRVSAAKNWAGGARALLADKFDIVAVTDAGASQSQMALMLRALLRDRFKLVAHRETQYRPIYALVTARKDGRLGPRLRPSTVDCSVIPVTPQPSPVQGDFVAEPCTGLRNVSGKATGRAVTIQTLARLMSGWVDDHRPVEDRTGLRGGFDIDLDWTPDRPQPADASAVPAVHSGGEGLFTALQEQLGLKLEPAKDGVDTLVVDSAEPPTAN